MEKKINSKSPGRELYPRHGVRSRVDGYELDDDVSGRVGYDVSGVPSVRKHLRKYTAGRVVRRKGLSKGTGENRGGQDLKFKNKLREGTYFKYTIIVNKYHKTIVAYKRLL